MRRASALLRRRSAATDEDRRRYSFNQYLEEVFSYNGVPYQIVGPKMPAPNEEESAGKLPRSWDHTIVGAAVLRRALVLSQIAFRWRDVRTRQLFGTPDLDALNFPSPWRTLPDLLAKAETHVSYFGNAWFFRDMGSLSLLDPEKVSTLTVLDGRGTGGRILERRVHYWPDGIGQGTFDVIPSTNVAHWPALDLDPTSDFVGLSWVRQASSEIAQDNQASVYIRRFFDNAATPSLVVSIPREYTREQAELWAEMSARELAGVDNAHKVHYMGVGADVRPIGSNIQDLALKDLRGELESRVAARSLVPAVILGVPTSAVTGGSALNAGNYSTTRRVWADTWFSPTVAALCRALQRLYPPPPGGELWFDPTDVMFIQEDRADEAEIVKSKVAAIRQGIDAGFDPDSVVRAVADGNFDALVGAHTGLTSVQLQPPADGETPPMEEE